MNKSQESDTDSTDSSSVINLVDSEVKVIYFRESDMKQKTKKPTPVKEKSQEWNLNASKAPVLCPLLHCRHPLRSREILSHCINDHKIKLYKASPQQKQVLNVTDLDFIFNQVVCLGILAYDGPHPSLSFSSETISNILLPLKFKEFVNHIPVLVLGMRTNVVDLLTPRSDYSSCSSIQTPEERSPVNDVVLIWLATSPAAACLYAQISAVSHNSLFSYSMTVKTRPLETVDEKIESVREEHCLRLNHTCLRQLSTSVQQSFKLEIQFHAIET